MTFVKNKKSKFIKGSVAWALIVMALAFFPNQVYAKNTVEFKESYGIKEEKFVEYCLKIPEKSHVAGVTIEIQYDSKQLKLVEGSVGEVLSSSISKLNQNIEGKVILTAISTEVIVEKGEILNLKWEVINSAESHLNIKCVITECVDQECVSLKTSIESKKQENPLYKDNDIKSEKNEKLKTDKEVEEKQKEDKPTTNTDVEKKNEKTEKQEVDSKKLNKQQRKNNNDKKNHWLEITIISLAVAILAVALSFIVKNIRRKRK